MKYTITYDESNPEHYALINDYHWFKYYIKSFLCDINGLDTTLDIERINTIVKSIVNKYEYDRFRKIMSMLSKEEIAFITDYDESKAGLADISVDYTNDIYTRWLIMDIKMKGIKHYILFYKLKLLRKYGTNEIVKCFLTNKNFI